MKKKVNEVTPRAESAYTVRFEAPRAIKQAKPATAKNAKATVSRKFR